MRKCEFRNQNLKSLKRNYKTRNENFKRFKTQTQIPQPKIENSAAQLRIDCLRSVHKFRYLKKFFSKFLHNRSFKSALQTMALSTKI